MLNLWEYFFFSLFMVIKLNSFLLLLTKETEVSVLGWPLYVVVQNYVYIT